MEQKIYPVHKLDANITAILQTIITADIPGCISKGLSNEIHFIDEYTSITCPAKIVPDKLNGGCYVQLSAAYCQYLWLVCDIALKTIDCDIILQECKKIGGNIEDYKSSVNEILQYPKEKLLNLLQMSGYDIDLDQYYDYLKRSISIIDIEKLTNELEMDYCLLLPLTDNSKAIDIEKYYQINFDGAYEEKVNAMYCFGITFILLHELSHFTLGHLHKDEEITDETDADIAAFWEINGSLDEQRLFSAYCGLICVLFSLLYLNPDMIEDGIHPREDKRIFDIYENIKDENIKFTLLIIHMFKLWKDLNNIQGFPDLDIDNPVEAIYHIKSFLSGPNQN